MQQPDVAVTPVHVLVHAAGVVAVATAVTSALKLAYKLITYYLIKKYSRQLFADYIHQI